MSNSGSVPQTVLSPILKNKVRIAKKALTAEEDDLTDYSVQKQVINYDEQSKALALTKYATDDRMEAVQRNYGSAVALRQMLENKMDIRAKIIRTNTNLLQELEKSQHLEPKHSRTRNFYHRTKSEEKVIKLQREKDALQKAEEKISHLSDNLNEYGFSKEGVGIREMVTEWLTACINEAKAKAEVKVLVDRQRDIIGQYREFSPVRHSNQAKKNVP